MWRQGPRDRRTERKGEGKRRDKDGETMNEGGGWQGGKDGGTETGAAREVKTERGMQGQRTHERMNDRNTQQATHT